MVKENQSPNQGVFPSDPLRETLLHKNQSHEEKERRDSESSTGGKRRKISLVSGVIMAGKLAIATAAFSLPLAFQRLSLAMGIALIFLYAAANWMTFNLLAYVSSKINVYDYSLLMRHYLGRTLEQLYNFSMFFSCSIVIVAYTNVAYDILGQLLYEVVYRYDGIYDSSQDFVDNGFMGELSTRYYVITGLLIIIYFPISLFQSVAHLSKVAVMASMGTLYMVVIIVAQSSGYYSDFLKHQSAQVSHAGSGLETVQEVNWTNWTTGFTSELFFFVASGNIILTFDCQFGLLSIYETLEDRRLNKLYKLNNYGVIVITVMLLLIGITGFLTSPIEGYELIFFRKALGDSDWLMALGKLSLIISTLTDVCLNNYWARQSFFAMAFKQSEISQAEGAFYSLISYVILCFIAINLKSIVLYLSFAGGLSSTTYCFVFPCMMYYKANGLGIKHWKNIAVITVTVIISIIGLFGGFLSLINLF
mmetsp:Transcript_19072/g.19793  ORF Transcript_19072/g.19793 Transcript_19072/m.19793 type:complete len:477 (-) Transcript_19072:117-1547(-)